MRGTWSHTPVKSEGREGLEGGDLVTHQGGNLRELGHTHLSRAKVEKVLKEGLGHTSRRELGHTHLSRAKVEKVLEGGTWSHIKEGT